MIRVPSVNPNSTQFRIARLEAKLSALAAIPSERRQAEYVEEKSAAIIEVIEALKGSSDNSAGANLNDHEPRSPGS